jgi:hypothetical protein
MKNLKVGFYRIGFSKNFLLRKNKNILWDFEFFYFHVLNQFLNKLI